MISKYRTFGLMLLILWGCGSGESSKIFRLPPDSDQTLAGTNRKTWKLAKRTNNGTRVNMGECTLHYRQTFYANHQVEDNNSLRSDCGDSMNGKWNLSENESGVAYLSIASEVVPKYFEVPEGSITKHFQLVELTDKSLVYTFKHKLFSTKPSIVVDYLIPADSVFEDRNFHH